jgi:hypothetical protein
MNLAGIASVAVPDEVFAPAEEIDVFCWRMEELIRAGYSAVAAGTLADRADVDLHRACRLLVQGCDERTALRILC